MCLMDSSREICMLASSRILFGSELGGRGWVVIHRLTWLHGAMPSC